MDCAKTGTTLATPSSKKKILSTRTSSFGNKEGESFFTGVKNVTATTKVTATTQKRASISNATTQKRASISKPGYSIPKKDAGTSSKEEGKPKYDQDVTKNFDAMINGDLSYIPKLPKSMVRIFLSSTFSDMRAERNTLARNVYPKLRDLCATRDLDFEVVDMRWGINEDSQNEHSVEKLCLLEVENCQKHSRGPNFIVLSGNRYGFRPIPEELDVKMFEILHQAASKLNLPDKALLEEWYKLDTNAVPNKYILQNIRSKFTFFGDFSPGCDKPRAKDTAAWWKTFEALQVILRKAASHAYDENNISENDRHKFLASVTESEIQDGILKAKDVDDHCLVYRREFKDLHGVNITLDNAPRFIDCINTDKDRVIDEEVTKLRESLFEDKIAKKLSKANIRNYSLTWGHNGLDPDKHKEHQEYLEMFCNDFIGDCTRLIKKADIQHSNPINTSNYYTYYTETIHHLSFCLTKCESFSGQESVLNKAKEYILQERTRSPLIIHAESGVGKTAIMAMIMKSVPVWLQGKSHTKLIRFLGTTPATIDIEDVLFYVLGQLADNCDLIMPPVNYANMKALQDYAPRFLRQVASAAKEPVIILLDSVDQLGPADGAYSMKWLPLLLPTTVKLIVSTLPKEHGILANLKKLLPNPECYVEVPPLPEKTGQEITEMYLKKRRRTITGEQMTLLLSVFRQSPNPLFLRLLLDEARKWNSYTKLNDIDLAVTVKKAINKLFEKLENKFGHSLVSHALGYLTIGLQGLTEFEIEDALSCDDVVLNDVYRFHDPPVPGIVTIPPVLWARIHYDIKDYLSERISYKKTTLNWYHRQFIETARERYTNDGKAIPFHKNMTEIYLQDKGVKRSIVLKNRGNLEVTDADRQVTPQPFTAHNQRKLACLPYHANRAYSLLGKDVVKSRILCNFKFLCSKIEAFSVSDTVEVLTDFLEITKDDEVELLRSFISGSKENFTQPVRFAFCLVGSLNPEGQQINLVQMVNDARFFLQSQGKPSLIPYFPCMAPRHGSAGSMLTSVQGVSDILAQSSTSLLLKLQDSPNSDEVRSPYAIFSLNSLEMTSVDLPKKVKKVGQFVMNDTSIYFVSESALVSYNFKEQKTVECVFEQVVPHWDKSKLGMMGDCVSNAEASFGVMVIGYFMILVDLQKMCFGQKFETGKATTKFETCLLTNDEEIFAMGQVVNSSPDNQPQGPDQRFICKFGFKEDRPTAYFDTEKNMNFGVKTFANEYKTLYIIATSIDQSRSGTQKQKGNDDGKVNGNTQTHVMIFDSETLSLSKTIDVDDTITNIMGHPEKCMVMALSSQGAVYCLSSKVDRKIQLDYPVVNFTALWDDSLLLLCSGGGNVTIYNYDTSTNLGAFTAFPVQITDIRLLDQMCMTLASNCELKIWSVKSLLSDVKEKLSSKDMDTAVSTLHNQLNISAIAVSENEEDLFTCASDGFIYVWDNTTLNLIQKFNIEITANTLHSLNVNVVAHDTVLGKMTILNPYTGKSVFHMPNSVQNIKHSVLNATKTTMYLISSPKPGVVHIDIVNVEKLQFVKSIGLQYGLSCENVSISLSQNERYLIINSLISEAEFESISTLWKTGGFGPQNYRHKFHAVDLTQGSGALIPCHRLLSKIPCLGNSVKPGGMNTMLITCRRHLVNWDIPTGKYQKRAKDLKEPRFYRPTWLGQKCVGPNTCMEHDPEYKILAVGSEDGYMFVYDFNTGQPPGRKKPSSKHSGKVETIAISPNGKWVVSACSNKVLKLWDASSVTEHFSVKLDGELQQVFFNHSSDRLFLFTGSQTTRLMIFSLHTGVKK